MANAEVPVSSPEPQRAKRPPDAVVPPPPTPPAEVESRDDAALVDSDGGCPVAGSELESKTPGRAGSGALPEGKAAGDSSFEKDILGEEIMAGNVIKLETVKEEEEDFDVVRLDTGTPEQPVAECQVVKSGSQRKRKLHDGSRSIESLFERADRRLTRSNSRIITKGRNNCQKVAKRLTRSQKSSPADYVGNVDILGVERTLRKFIRTGSKRVLQEPNGDAGVPNSPPEKHDCVMSDVVDSDGLSDVANRGVIIIDEIMETIQEEDVKPIVQEVDNWDHPSDELESNRGSAEADEDVKLEEANAVSANDDAGAAVLPEVPSTAVEVSGEENKSMDSKLETPSKRITRSAMRNAQVESAGISGLGPSMHELKDSEKSMVHVMEVSSSAVVVSTVENKLDSSRLTTPSRRFTRAALKNVQLDVNSFLDDASSMNLLIPKSENANEQEEIAAEELIRGSAKKPADGVILEKRETDVPSRRFTRSALKNAQMDVTPFLGFKSTIDEPRSEIQDAEMLDATQVTIKLENSELETPSKRITRSALKNAQTTSSELQLPPRRFTRSLLKCNESHDEEIEAGETGVPESSESCTRKVSSSSQKGNKVDGRPTMSGGCKKFNLIKPPSNARELLASGFLEGLDVMYITPHSKKPVLKGVIKSGNILCFCSDCKGFRSVSAYNFEVHAGSSKKHPSDFIFLENGNTLRDVLTVCSSAKINDLEAALKNEVSTVPKKNLRACLKCGSLLTSDVHKFFLCESCSETSDSNLTMIQSPGPSQRSPIPVDMLSKSLSSSTSPLLASTKKTSSVGRLTRKNTGLHKLVFMGDILPEGTEVAYYVGGKRLLEGYIKEGAIFCQCCMAVVSPSQFEAHAGQATRRKPYNNIYTSNGVSLHELSVSLSKHKMISLGETDDLCSICSDNGDLIVCDFCPRAFHKECVGLTENPEEDWYCQFCVSLHRRDNCVANNDNARAAGRVEGVDPIEQIFKRCIRIVSISATDLGGCTICKLHDFSQSGFDDRTVILCDQCQREYHVGCLRDSKMADLKEVPEGEWFCTLDCSITHGALKELILGGPQSLTSSDIELIRRKTEAKGSTNNENDENKEKIDYNSIRWRLLSGASAQEAEVQLLSGAVSIFHESFDPIIDAKSERDLIPAMVNGMSIEGHQDYSGMYCAVLTIGSKVVSAGLLRVFGTDAAELPLVATSRDLQGLGYFQVLFGCMERMLIELKVRNFLLPAAEEAESIWTKKFGFSRISSDQVEEYLKGAHLTAFRGTSSLHKPLFQS